MCHDKSSFTKPEPTDSLYANSRLTRNACEEFLKNHGICICMNMNVTISPQCWFRIFNGIVRMLWTRRLQHRNMWRGVYMNRCDEKNIVSLDEVQNKSRFTKRLCPAASRLSVGVAIESCAFVNAPGVFFTLPVRRVTMSEFHPGPQPVAP